MNCCVDIRACNVDYVDLSAQRLSRVSVDALAQPTVELHSKLMGRTEFLASAISYASLNVEHICSFNSGAVMVVSPEYVWLNEGNDFSADFNVISNVDWFIE